MIRSRHRSLLGALGLLCSAVVVPGALAAQSCDANNQYMNLVRQQAIAAGDVYASEGYEVSDMLCGSLNENGESWFDTTIIEGSRVAYVAVCDQDCSDIDLHLYAGNTLIAEDVLDDDVPILELGPTVSGVNYRLKVSMFSCSNEPCYFGIAMFSR